MLRFNALNAQSPIDSTLYASILTNDSLLFTVGFNTCDLHQFEQLLHEDFEFFHDKGGIANREKFLNDLRNGLCKDPANYQSRRELVKGSTEIFPMYNGKTLYGAIQIGVHRFYETIKGHNERYASTAKFTHVWLLENGAWKLSRSLSYDHQAESQSKNEMPNFENDTEVEKWIKEINVPTLGIGVIKQGKLQNVKVFGEITSGMKAPHNTIFNVASLTKPVTAFVALKLASMGDLDLDEPIYTYWTDPDIANDHRHKKITTRIILSHQTGFPNWRWMNANKQLQFLFDPGTDYAYSGEGFEYLRKALENKLHNSLQQLADVLIFSPLKMMDTRYIWSKEVDTSRLAKAFDAKGNEYLLAKNTIPNAADDLLTTIEDYGNFLVAVMNGTVLSDSINKEMMTPQVESTQGKHFGLGFEIYNFNDGNIALSHGGSDKGVQTIAFVIPKTKQGLIIFTNVDDGVKVFEPLLIHYLGQYGKEIIDIETK